MTETTKKGFDWASLVATIQNDECVLVLGPRAACSSKGPLEDQLAEAFAREADWDWDARKLPLAAAVKAYRRSFDSPEDALAGRERVMRQFYAKMASEKLELLDAVAKMPFKYIINTAPDDLLLRCLINNDKSPLEFSYHYDNSEFNAEQNKKAVHLDREISEDKPLIFNLFGRFTHPASVVLTDEARLKFLDEVLQRDNDSQANISYHFIKPAVNSPRKSFVFIGFDFSNWHLRLFLHLLGRKQKYRPMAISLEPPKDAEAAAFFRENYQMTFLDETPMGFLTKLAGEIRRQSMPEAPAPIELLILYDEKDAAERDMLETHLAPLRAGRLVNVWHEGKVAIGSDIATALADRVNSVQVIVPILTSHFLANDQMFDKLIPLAIERHFAQSAKLVPIVMKPCSIAHTPLAELKSVFPKPIGKSVEELDREGTPGVALTEFVRRLSEIIENMAKNKPQTATP